MIFTVTWVRSAQDELTELWLQAPDKQAVTAAANRIDKELRIDAHNKGLPFFGDRLLRVSPLLVVFSVYPDDCLAEIVQVMRV